MPLFSLILNLLYNPSEAWQYLANTNYKYPRPILMYAMPFIFLGAFSFFINRTLDFYSHLAIFEMVINILVNASALVFSIHLIKQLAPRYKSLDQIPEVTLVMVYGLTPLFIISLFAHFILKPEVVFFMGVVLSAYPISQGFKIIMKTPEHMLVGFTILAMMLFLGINFFFSVVLSNFLALFQF